MTKVVNIYKDKYDVYIGRAGQGHDGYFGNPYVLSSSTTREEVLEKYKKYFYNRIEKDEDFKRRILDLKDKTLGCFCHPKPCHGHVIANYLDGSICF